VLQPPDRELVLDHAEPVLKLCDPLLCRHRDPPLSDSLQ
jgi:hypothetical protein